MYNFTKLMYRKIKVKTVQINSMMHKKQDILGQKKLDKNKNMPKANKKT